MFRSTYTKGLKILLAAGVLSAGGCGGDEGVGATDCVERWNTGKHEHRDWLARAWRKNAVGPPPAASAWVGKSDRDPSRCAVIATFMPDGSYIIFDELLQDRPGAFDTDPGENMSSEAAAAKLESSNAVGAPGGQLMLK